MTEAFCPCGSDRPYPRCCGPYIAGDRPAPTAEALMRSRFTAYAHHHVDYLLSSWHPDTRPDAADLGDLREIKWLKLTVDRVTEQGPDEAMVSFTARYKIAGKSAKLKEVSRFKRLNGKWYYVDGDILS